MKVFSPILINRKDRLIDQGLRRTLVLSPAPKIGAEYLIVNDFVEENILHHHTGILIV